MLENFHPKRVLKYRNDILLVERFVQKTANKNYSAIRPGFFKFNLMPSAVPIFLLTKE